VAKRSPQRALRTYYRAAIVPAFRAARPAAAAQVISPPASRNRLLSLLPIAGLLGVAGLAYWFSLGTVFRTVNAAPACLLAALALAASRRQRPAPDIHDRYTDYIVGLPLLAGALLLLGYVPSQLSVFAWLWRLDLLSLPLLVAGSIAIAFGVRALWLQRLPLATLFLPWILWATGLARNPIIIVATASLAVATLTDATIATRRAAATSHWIAFRRRPLSSSVAAVAVLVAVSVTAALADGALARAQPLFDNAGQPRISAAAAMPALRGWAAYHQLDYPWIQRYLGADASWQRYAYAGQDLEHPALVVDAISVKDLSQLSGRDLDVFYRLQHDQMIESRSVMLRNGLIVHVVRYSDPARAIPWLAVYWDWPLKAGHGLQYERLVLSAAGTQALSDATLVAFAQRFVDAAVAQADR